MFRPLFVLIALVPAGHAVAQPRELKLPNVPGGRSVQSPVDGPEQSDPIDSYRSRREAALAAFQSGYKAATVERKNSRAYGLFLLALRRDPQIPAALYNLGILCAREMRWTDALLFLREARLKAPPDSEIGRLAAHEIERAELMGTAEGSKRRDFDIKFLTLLRAKNPSATLGDLVRLAKTEPGRWEAPALAGMIRADSGAFAESIKDLEDAARLAGTRGPRLKSAAEVARREAAFGAKVGSADALWEKQQYEIAAKMYAEAWEDSPGHWNTAFDAATGFLLADQTELAVRTLSRARGSAPANMQGKVAAMLKELAAISEEAKRESDRRPAVADAPVVIPAARIRELVGTLTNPQMEIAVRPEPPLLEDRTRIIPVPDKEIDKADLLTLSTERVFDRYRRDLLSAPVPNRGSLPASDLQAPLAPEVAPESIAPPQTARTPTLSPVVRSRPLSGQPPVQPLISPPKGVEIPVTIVSTPPGATVKVDGTMTCDGQCQVMLAPGRHTLRATMKGYRDALNIFTIDKGKAPPAVEVVLISKRGWLFVESEVPGAPIYLNGMRTSERTPAQFTLDEGEHQVGVETGGTMKSLRVNIEDEGRLRVRF